jgi:hypothetical protein
MKNEIDALKKGELELESEIERLSSRINLERTLKAQKSRLLEDIDRLTVQYESVAYDKDVAVKALDLMTDQLRSEHELRQRLQQKLDELKEQQEEMSYMDVTAPPCESLLSELKTSEMDSLAERLSQAESEIQAFRLKFQSSSEPSCSRKEMLKKILLKVATNPFVQAFLLQTTFNVASDVVFSRIRR